MITAFKQYLSTLNLGAVSRKLYLSDVKRFLDYLSHDQSSLTISQVSSTQVYLDYLNHLRSGAIALSMLKRTIASLKQFGSFLTLTYAIENPTLSLATTDSLIDHSANQPVLASSQLNFKYINHFTNYLNAEHLSPLTIKSYKSDLARYLDWATHHLPSTQIGELLIDKNIELYLNHLTDYMHTLPSTIERKLKSLTRFKVWYQSNYSSPLITDSRKKAPESNFSTISPMATTSTPTNLQTAPGMSMFSVKNFNYRNLATLVILLLFTSTLAIFGYRQFSRDVRLTSAYPSTPVTPNRQLSFQGRLEDSAGTPITSATNLTFKLFDAASSGTQLYSSGVCSLTPDSDGVFSTQIGSTCGSAIASSVFTENANVWLEVTVASETLSPRQAIASVAYALNSETLQGFPISSTVSAIRNTVVPMNQWGEILIGEQSPRLKGVSGTFQISAPALSLTTATGTNGNITLAPDGTGQVNLNGNTTSTNFFNVANAQLTTGSLITGTAANNNTGYKLLDLLSGSSPTSKFSVSDAGNTTIAGTLTLPNSNTLTGVANYTQLSNGLSVGGATTYYLNSSGNLNANTGTFGGTLQANGTLDANGQVDLGDGGDTITLNASSITLTGVNCSANTNGGTLTTNGSGVLQCSDDDSGAGGSSSWRSSLGALSPLNDTWDLLVGGVSTASAKAGFVNINSGTPTATISAGTAGAATLTATGVLGTTAMQSLTLGNSTTGNILLDRQVKIGSDYDLIPLSATGTNDLGSSAIPWDNLYSNSITLPTFTAGSVVFTGTSGVLSQDNTNFFFDDTLNRLGIGINSNLLATLDVRATLGTAPAASISGTTSQSALVVDQSGVGDLFTASKSGATKFVISNSGNVGIGVAAPSSKLQIGGTTSTISNSSGDLTIDSFSGNVVFGTDDDLIPTLGAGSADIGAVATPWDNVYATVFTQNGNLVCDVSGANCPTSGTNYWRSNLGTLSPLSDSYDLLLGANATSSAKIGLININSGTPTLSFANQASNITVKDATANALQILEGSNAYLALTTTNASENLSFGNATTNPSYSFLGSGTTTFTGAGTFTGTLTADGTLDANGTVTLGDGGDAVTLDSNALTLQTTGAGSDITLNAVDQIILTDFTTCTALETVGGVLTCGTDDTGGGSGSSNWRSSLGALSPLNDTWDLLVGGAATSSAKIGLININSGTPTLSFANQASNITVKDATANALQILEGSNAYLALTTTNASENLSFGNATTNPSYSFLGSGTTTFTGDVVANGNTTLGNAITDTITFGGRVAQDSDLIPITATGTNDLGSSSLPWDNLYSNSITLPTFTAGSVVFTGTSGVLSQDNTNFFFDDTLNRLGIGINSNLLATLDVRATLGTAPAASISGTTSQSALVVDQSGVGDLFTASKSGATKFVISNSGNVGIGVAAPSSKLQIGGTTSTISNSSGDLTIDSFSGNVVFGTDDDLIPTLGAGSADIGSSSLPWDNLYTTNLSYAGGAGTITLADNTASAFRLIEGANVYFDITTTNNAESFTLNLPVGGATSHTANLFNANIAQTINLGTGTAADTINIGTGGTTADDINIGGLSTSHTDFTGILNLAGGTTYKIDASGNATFLDIVASDTGNPGLTVGNGTVGYAKIGGSTISDNSGNLTFDSDSNAITFAADDTTLTASGIATIDTAATVAWDVATLNATSLATIDTAASLNLATTTLTLDSNSTINGGSASNDDLTLQGTSNATRTTSYVLIQPSGGKVGIGNSAPGKTLDVTGDIQLSGSFYDTYVTGGITLGDSSNASLVGYTSNSIVGALNEVKGANKYISHNDYYSWADNYIAKNEGTIFDPNPIINGLFFDTFADPTKMDSSNSTSSGTIKVQDPSASVKPTAPFRVGLMNNQTYDSSATDNAGNTYLGANTTTDIFYYDRTLDSSPDILTKLGIDPNWYNGVSLVQAASASGYYTPGSTAYSTNPNLTTSYNGSLLKVTGTRSTGKNIAITIKTPTTFDWTDYVGNSATGVTMTFGTAQQLGATGIYVTFTATSYNIGDVFNIASWYIETAGSTRGSKQQFPERSNIIATASSVDIIDADTQKLWMRFSQGTGYVLDVDANNNPSAVFAQNGLLAVSLNGSSAVGLRIINFHFDSVESVNASHKNYSESPVAGRNASNTFTVNGTAPFKLQNVIVNDVHGNVVQTSSAPDTYKAYLVTADDTGLTVFHLTDQVSYGYSDATNDDYNAVWITSSGMLYGVNETRAQVERWVDVHADTASRLNSATLDEYWDEATDPAIFPSAAAPTIQTSGSTLYVTENTSTNSNSSDTIYVGTNKGVGVVNSYYPQTAYDSTKFYTTTYITDEMLAGTRLMLPMAGTSALSASTTLTGADADVSNRASPFTTGLAATVPTHVSGVRGNGLTFDGGDYLCTGTTGTCANDTDYTVTTGDYTWSTWLKIPSGGSGANEWAFASKGLSNTDGYILTLYYNYSDKTHMTRFTSNQAAAQQIIEGSRMGYTIVPDQWFHVAWVKSGTTVTSYINGVVSSTGTITNPTSSTRPLIIGGINNGATGATAQWPGGIDDFMTAIVPLTASQINNIYKTGARALSSHSASLGGGGAELNQQLGYASTGTDTVGAVKVDYNNQYMYVGLNSTTLGGVSKIQLNSDTNVKTYLNAANVPTGGTAILDEDVNALGVGYQLETVGSAASGVKSMAYDTNSTALTGSLFSKTQTLPSATKFAYFWANYVTDSSDASNGINVYACNAYATKALCDSNNAWVLGSTIQTITAANPPEKEYSFTFPTAGSYLTFKIDFKRGSTKTNTYLSRYGASWGSSTGGADIAERYESTEPVYPGDILSITTPVQAGQAGVSLSRQPYDQKIIGVVTTNPGIVMDDNLVDLNWNAASRNSPNRPAVALAGRVPLKVTTQNGPILVGDAITSSAKPGYGVKALKAGNIVAKALEGFSCDSPNASALESGICEGTVLAFINVSWYDPDVYLTSIGDFSFLAQAGTASDSATLVTSSNPVIKLVRILSSGATEIIDRIGTFGQILAGLVKTQNLEVATISPIASGSAITINGPVVISPNLANSPYSPELVVDGEIDAATISAREALLTDIQAETITANHIVADTITANHIEGLDAKIASLSSNLSDSELGSITDRIKARLSLLTGNIPSASDLPVPPEASNSANLANLPNTANSDFVATDSATLAAIDADFVTINNYLAVIGQATITDLDITSRLYAANIESKTGLINLGGNTLIVDVTGSVMINGDLTVSGQILADSAELNSLQIGAPNAGDLATPSSELGKLLSIYNESGVPVATIDASGSANLASLTTGMITIASSGDATSSSLLSSNISTNATAGESILISPNTELIIESPHVTPNSLVYLTPTGNTGGKVLFVKAKNTCPPLIPDSSNLVPACTPSFTVGIDSPVSSDISFNWWIIALEKQL